MASPKVSTTKSQINCPTIREHLNAPTVGSLSLCISVSGFSTNARVRTGATAAQTMPDCVLQKVSHDLIAIGQTLAVAVVVAV